MVTEPADGGAGTSEATLSHLLGFVSFLSLFMFQMGGVSPVNLFMEKRHLCFLLAFTFLN